MSLLHSSCVYCDKYMSVPQMDLQQYRIVTYGPLDKTVINCRTLYCVLFLLVVTGWHIKTVLEMSYIMLEFNVLSATRQNNPPEGLDMCHKTWQSHPGELHYFIKIWQSLKTVKHGINIIIYYVYVNVRMGISDRT